jgi:hypothetical protein
MNQTSIDRSMASVVAIARASVPFIIVVLGLALSGCTSDTGQPSQPAEPVPGAFLASGEELLIGALDEVVAIADWAGSLSSIPPQEGVPAGAAGTEADSVYVYGEVTPDGFGAIVTERHGYPKGLLLITVRRSFGRDGGFVSEVKRYISNEGFAADLPQQSIVTEVLPLLRDTIVTHVVRNGNIETYTFRLPVVTRTINQVDNSMQVTSRFALNGAIVAEVNDGVGTLIRRTLSSVLPSGALQTRTEYPDGRWRTVSTLGRADGSILREITSGE